MRTTEQKKAQQRLRRLLARVHAAGFTGRELMLLEVAQDEAEEWYRDNRFYKLYAEGTLRDRVRNFEEIFTERDFGSGLAEDYLAQLQVFGVPRVTKAMRQSADVHECFIGRTQ